MERLQLPYYHVSARALHYWSGNEIFIHSRLRITFICVFLLGITARQNCLELVFVREETKEPLVNISEDFTQSLNDKTTAFYQTSISPKALCQTLKTTK